MLTRLKVCGFKNLADVDVRFGPFTCIAGDNGVGKSNLFDAILFLSALADRPLMDAAKCVRDEQRRSTDIGSLFLKIGDQHVREMSFEVEMIVPPEGFDDLGQRARATITFLRYTLVLQCRTQHDHPSAEQLEVKREELRHIKLSEAKAHLAFEHSKRWRESVVRGRRSGGAFISTEGEGDSRVVKLHQDKGGGRPRALAAANLPRTVLSSADALEAPTALLARREMQSWRLLQLEPTALRLSDPFHSPVHVAPNGAHLASTLHHLARGGDEDAVYARVANRLSQLVEDIHSLRVDVDPKRELFTLQVLDRDRSVHPARALSDGTLRFLALTILELDPDARGVVCFEEPENGIHPSRVSAMLQLLRDLAVDVNEEVDQDNPLRQVIINTHSPAVVGLVSDADLLIAEPKEVIVLGQRCGAVRFSWLSDTWRHRAEPETRTTARGSLGPYLNPLAEADERRTFNASGCRSSNGLPRPKQVKDRKDLQMLLPGVSSE